MKNPEETIRRYYQALNNFDLDSLVDLYEPGAVVWDYPVHMSSNKKALRDYFIQNHRSGVSYIVQGHISVKDGDIAMSRVHWSASGSDDVDEHFTLEGISKDILRKQSDGSWLIVLDNPWGADILNVRKMWLPTASSESDKPRRSLPFPQEFNDHPPWAYATSH